VQGTEGARKARRRSGDGYDLSLFPSGGGCLQPEHGLSRGALKGEKDMGVVKTSFLGIYFFQSRCPGEKFKGGCRREKALQDRGK